MTGHSLFRALLWLQLAAWPALTASCVLPVGPKFEDPPGNTPPYLANSNPPEGAVLTGDSLLIEALVGDTDQDDILMGRWLIDYPPFDPSLSRLAQEFRLPSTGRAERGVVRFAPSCVDHLIATGLASHRVTLSIADRPFLPQEVSPPNLQLDSAPPEGFVLRATWVFELDCP